MKKIVWDENTLKVVHDNEIFSIENQQARNDLITIIEAYIKNLQVTKVSLRCENGSYNYIMFEDNSVLKSDNSTYGNSSYEYENNDTFRVLLLLMKAKAVKVDENRFVLK